MAENTEIYCGLKKRGKNRDDFYSFRMGGNSDHTNRL